MDRERRRDPEPAARHTVRQQAAPAVARPIGNAALARFAEGAGVLPNGTVHQAVERELARRAGRGRRLDIGMRSWAERALGIDPSRVSVHHDAEADALARSVAARAFAVRSDVYFAAGEYRPQSRDGRRLLAHELTHVAQQAGEAGASPLKVTEPGDVYERQADDVAREFDR